MDRIFVLKAGVLGGVVVFGGSIFVKNSYGNLAMKIIGGLMLFFGALYFIAGDRLFGKKEVKYSKELDAQINAGTITEAEAFVILKKQYADQIELEKQKLALEQQKAELTKLKKGKVDYSGIVGDDKKLPDVLGNLSGIIGNGNVQPQPYSSVDKPGMPKVNVKVDVDSVKQRSMPNPDVYMRKENTFTNSTADYFSKLDGEINPKKKAAPIKKKESLWD